MVGERGPEAVHLPRGAQVIPNDVLTARRSQRQGDINIHVNVPSSTSGATADQIATRTGLAVRRALNRNA
jgi:divalent metal cation (Fe/Co/Zn/Cd) transporter